MQGGGGGGRCVLAIDIRGGGGAIKTRKWVHDKRNNRHPKPKKILMKKTHLFCS